MNPVAAPNRWVVSRTHTGQIVWTAESLVLGVGAMAVGAWVAHAVFDLSWPWSIVMGVLLGPLAVGTVLFLVLAVGRALNPGLAA
jgi:hypothetical protein